MNKTLTASVSDTDAQVNTSKIIHGEKREESKAQQDVRKQETGKSLEAYLAQVVSPRKRHFNRRVGEGEAAQGYGKLEEGHASDEELEILQGGESASIFLSKAESQQTGLVTALAPDSGVCRSC